MREAQFYHALNIAKCGEYRALQKLRSKYASWEDAWLAEAGLPFANASAMPDPRREWERLAETGISLLLNGDGRFPAALREIPYSPHGIYLKGSFALPEASLLVAIVGTRRASEFGKRIARKFAYELGRAGIGVVSGLAFGIDAAAHAGALDAEGFTVAVLANGADEAHPRSNAGLAARILANGGGIVSEYPPGSPALPRRFLERNRLISGLARGTVIIEAPEHSGAITTARFALEQNRDLFVVPGPADHPRYRGSHKLIRSGAALVAEPEDLFFDLGLDPMAARASSGSGSPAEELVLAALRASGKPLGIDEIIEAATLTSSVVNQALTMLTLKSAIQEENGRYGLCN